MLETVTGPYTRQRLVRDNPWIWQLALLGAN